MTSVNVSVNIRQLNVIVTLAATIIVRIYSVVGLQAFTLGLDHQVLLLIDIGDSLVVFGLFMKLSCKSLLVLQLWLLNQVAILKSGVVSFSLNS